MRNEIYVTHFIAQAQVVEKWGYMNVRLEIV